METQVMLEDVMRAIEALRERGEKVTRRGVLAITGGGMTRVHRLMGEVLEIEERSAKAPVAEIGITLNKAILAEIGERVQEATAEMERIVNNQKERNRELLSDMEALEGQLQKETEALAQCERILEIERQDTKLAAAVATKENQDLRTRIEALEIERRQLIEAGEASRSELAKVQFQIERADKTAEQGEQRAIKAEGVARDLHARLVAAEKDRAVAVQHAKDLEARHAEGKALAEDRRQEIIALRSEIKELREKHSQDQQRLVLQIERALAQAEQAAKKD
ncbi:DNA-binding protein [Geoalkalibacter halelectricus]|uniref:DNA-binding protein n=1 Tax=Geoalkalibacter halelectricus TaxID=2847045 RepID=UPI00266EB517|nr:DNA-binding protein [Geoalkalibacter halelectricus]MDO3380402.1 DNA-binding protein [Geoalkalibacter halelectricus]